jgi:hypothetical protein
MKRVIRIFLNWATPQPRLGLMHLFVQIEKFHHNFKMKQTQPTYISWDVLLLRKTESDYCLISTLVDKINKSINPAQSKSEQHKMI